MTRILICRIGAIGDIIQTTPVVRALRRRYPDAHIAYVAGRGAEVLIEDHPDIDEVIPFDRRLDSKPAGLLRFCRALRARRFDLYVNLQFTFKTFLFGLASGAVVRTRYRRRRFGPEVHAVDNYLQALAPLGIDPAGCDRHLDFEVVDSARQEVESFVSSEGLQAHPALVLFNPGASVPSRQWPAAALATTLDLLIEQRPGWALAIVGGRGADEEVAARTLAAMRHPDKVRNWCGRLNFKQSAALFDRAAALVSMDTGPMHLGAAVGTPLVALFGPTSAGRAGPVAARVDRRGAQPVVLEAPAHLGCVPCRAKHCRRGDQACIALQPPQRVLEALDGLVNEGQPRPHALFHLLRGGAVPDRAAGPGSS